MTSIDQRPPNINPARQDQQIEQKTNVTTMLFSTFQNIQKVFTYTILTFINFFTSLPFKIMQKILYFLQKGARYLLWINIKGLVSSANLVYRFFAFFRVNKVVVLLQMIAKTYFPQYSMVDFNRAEQNISRFSLIMKKKNYDLINVDKFQKKVKTPTLFALYTNKKKERPHNDIQNQNVQTQNQQMVRQRNQQENGNQSVSPRLVRLSQSHQKIKKGDGSQGPSTSRGGDLRVEIPRERNVTDNRVFPDRDISPQRYMKPIPKIGEQTFQKYDYENEGDNDIPPYPSVGESEFARESRQQLQKQLLHLRGKMQQLIEDNSSYIRDLQEWLRQKSETVMMTRTQNIQLLEQMQQLQKQNIKKTQRLQHLQERVKQMEQILQKQKSQTGELCYQIVKLNEEIQQKSIDLVVLKDKINRSLKKFQQNQQNTSNLKDTQEKPEKSQDQLYDQGQTLQDKITLARLRREEKKTEQLAQKVQKVLKEERRRLEGKENETEIDEPNLIVNDPRQVEGTEQKQSQQKGEKKTRKRSQPRVLKQEGSNKITVSME